MTADNKPLGRFILDGIPPAPRGVPQVEVMFDIDANGILHVSAKDKATGKEQKITITGSTGLNKEEVERMQKEAETHAQEDKGRKELVEARNVADNMCYTAEKTLKDAGDKVDAVLKTEVEDKVKDLRAVLQTAPLDELKAKAEDLSVTLQKIGQAMYGSSAAAGGPPPGTPPGSGPQNGGDGGFPGPDQGGSDNPRSGDVKEGEIVEE